MEQLQPRADYTKEERLAERVSRIFGYDGLSIRVIPGAGWKTEISQKGVALVVDPDMLTPTTLKDASGADLPPGSTLPDGYSLYGITHELGHIDDYMHAKNETEVTISPSEDFFWNVLDDGVINRRLRNIPLINGITDEVYKNKLFTKDNYSGKDKHIQFMYGWLLRNVTPKRHIEYSPDVERALDGLKKVDINGHKYNLYDLLSDVSTSVQLRRAIARKYILPIYESFRQADKNKNNQNSDGSGDGKKSNPDQQPSNGQNHDASSGDSQGTQDGTGESNGDSSNDKDDTDDDTRLNQTYQDYKNASPCGEISHRSEESSKTNQSADDKDKDGDSSTPDEALKEAAGALANIRANKNAGSTNHDKEQSVLTSTGAGSIAAELELSIEDAEKYKDVIDKYRPEIYSVSKIFQQLTVPSIEYTSPRYQNLTSTLGSKISPRHLFQVAVANNSNIDPLIWKTVETISKKSGFSFNGLDIHFVVDASGSMSGEKAHSAAACSVILMEGLATARRFIERHNPQAPKPDVRIQVSLFGSSSRIVAPLSYDPKPKDKGIAFTTVMAAASSSTIVSGALENVAQLGRAYPLRTQLALIITDGNFSDTSKAASIVGTANSNVFFHQYIVQSPSTSPITKNYSYIGTPTELPKAMNINIKILAQKLLGS